MPGQAENRRLKTDSGKPTAENRSKGGRRLGLVWASMQGMPRASILDSPGKPKLAKVTDLRERHAGGRPRGLRLDLAGMRPRLDSALEFCTDAAMRA